MLVIVFLFAGCSTGSPDRSPAAPPDNEKLLYESVILNGRLFELELAVNPGQRADGLMGRESLADDQGMLFVYPDEELTVYSSDG